MTHRACLLHAAAGPGRDPVQGRLQRRQDARVGAEYKTDKAAYAALAGNAKDICIQEANYQVMRPPQIALASR